MWDQLDRLRRMWNRGGWIFEDARFLAARVELDPAAARACLPGGLRLRSPAMATLFVAHYPKTSFGSVYSEVGLFVDVRHRFRDAVHCPWMLVDDDVALILGRELLGYPKKIGVMSLAVDDEVVSATAARKGVSFLEMRGTVGALDPDPPPILGQRMCNVWGPVGFSLQRILCFRPVEEIIEARRVDLELQLQPSETDPLHGLVARVQQAHLYRTNIGGRWIPRPTGVVSPLHMLRNWSQRYA